MNKKSPLEPELNTVAVNGVTFRHQDIYNVIDDFYNRIQQDSILSVSFRSVHDWPEHIERLTHFWWIRFGGHPYLSTEYNPVTKHFFAGFNHNLLERWLGLFHQTLDDRLTLQQSHLWKLISERIGNSLSIKNEMYLRQYSKK
ncbi:group III truncated hemoglobin [Pseudobdellovibrio exovorus]|uniref:Globin n=1 Tax=Pseudobdellovibrio exovorus JSS TaxID=1184267 RepID=M4VBG0_9BACT|nr:group III truncated hemoglobin [Pseudobdellovibrio exovorus]AGH95361.1 hypothetical protein A11Q_1145 [Pseudobdellovibrio exovorus JSS]